MSIRSSGGSGVSCQGGPVADGRGRSALVEGVAGGVSIRDRMVRGEKGGGSDWAFCFCGGCGCGLSGGGGCISGSCGVAAGWWCRVAIAGHCGVGA